MSESDIEDKSRLTANEARLVLDAMGRPELSSETSVRVGPEAEAPVDHEKVKKMLRAASKKRREISDSPMAAEVVHPDLDARIGVAVLVAGLEGAWEDEPSPHPALLVQQVIGRFFRPRSPVEEYSPDRPVSGGFQDDLIPIDELLGRYFPARRTIEIYWLSVEDIARRRLSCDPADLRYIVRIHEYAHAVHHLGIPVKVDELELLDGVKLTKRGARSSSRLAAFRLATEEEHEWWAQAITYASLRILADPDRLIRVFRDLMDRQRSEYRVDIALLDALPASGIRFAFTAWESSREYLLESGQPTRTIFEALLRKIV